MNKVVLCQSSGEPTHWSGRLFPIDANRNIDWWNGKPIRHWLQIVAVDPPDCGCTDCIVGSSVPFDQAQPEHIAMALQEVIADHTSGVLRDSKQLAPEGYEA